MVIIEAREEYYFAASDGNFKLLYAVP